MQRTILILLKLTGAESVAKGLANAAKSTSNFAGRVKSQLSKLAQHAKWASVFIGAAFAKMVKDAVGLAAEFEKFSIAGEYLLGSAEAADAFSKSIRAIATESIFGIDQITNLGKRLVGSTKDAEKSESALRSLIDAVAATGGGYSELESATRAWIQTNAKAKASSEELNRQFANANIPVIRVLAEAIVKDLDHPLRKYIDSAGGATGASKKLTKAHDTASQSIGIYGKQVEKAELALKRVQESEDDNREAVLGKEIALEKAQARYSKATSTIGAYEKAQTSATTATVKAKISVEEVMAQLQHIGDLDIPGSIAAAAITDALNEAYGGANQRLVNSFSGQVEKLQDKVKLAVLAFLGLDESFRTIEGSIFDKLKNAFMSLNNWLDDNEEKLISLGKVLGQSLPFMIGFATFSLGIFAGALGGVLAPVLHLAIIVGGLGAAVGFLFQSFVDLSPIMERTTNDTLPQMSLATDTVEEAQSRWNDSIMTTVEKNEELRKKMLPITRAQDVFRGALDLLKTSVKNLSEAISLAIDPTGNWKFGIDQVAAAVTLFLFPISLLVQILSTLVIGLATTVEGFMAFYDIITGNMEGAVGHIENMQLRGEALIESWSNYGQAFDAWTTSAAYAFAQVDTKMMSHQTNFQNMSSNVMSSVQNMSTNVSSDYQSTATNVDKQSNLMSSITDTASGDMSDYMTTASSDILTDYETVFPDITDQVEKSHSAVLKSAEDIMPRFEDENVGAIKSIFGWFGDLIDRANEWITKQAELAGMGFGGGGGGAYQHGGIVPGRPGTAIPIIAHAGERIVPRGGADVNAGGGGITLNFYGSIQMDSEQRVQELAQQINRILGRQSELSRYGAGF